MRIYATDNCTSFGARIKINKQKIYDNLLKSAGEASVTGGSSSLLAGTSSGADMVVHGMPSAVPSAQNSSAMFDQFSHYGHKILKALFNGKFEHEAYDASFFSTSMSTSGVLTYSNGMDTIVKAINRGYERKIPT